MTAPEDTFGDLRSFLDRLRRDGDLVTVETPVDPRLVAVLDACAATEYRLRVSLIDGRGNTVAEAERPVQPEGVPITHLWAGRGHYALAPLLLDRDGGCYAVFASQTVLVEVERDDADRIKGCSAGIEPVLDLPESDAP